MQCTSSFLLVNNSNSTVAKSKQTCVAISFGFDGNISSVWTGVLLVQIFLGSELLWVGLGFDYMLTNLNPVTNLFIESEFFEILIESIEV